ncbi:thioredoxin-like protein [Usnea florida]
MDMPMNVPVDDPNADTEWNDILRKHGVIPEKPPSPTPLIQEALSEARKQAYENRLENKDLDELKDLEDEEDDVFLEKYRKQRMAELSTIATASVFNQVYPLQKPDYTKDVTEASNKAFVLVHLTSSLGTNVQSRLLTELWREMARQYGDIKFCEMRADMCIEGYPERNTPTILVYRDGDIKKQVVTLKELGGEQTTVKDLQNLLVGVGALNANDHRVITREDKEEPYSSIRTGRLNAATAEDESDEWD